MSSTQEAGDLFGEAGPAHAMMRSPTVLIASVGLWGMNIYFFRLFGIDYVKVLQHDLLKLQGSAVDYDDDDDNVNDASLRAMKKNADHERSVSANSVLSDFSAQDDDYYSDDEAEPPSAITWFRLVSLSILLLLVLHLTYFIWIDILKGGPVGAVFCFYLVVCLVICVPLNSLHWLRKSTVLVLQRGYELLNPRCGGLLIPGKPPRPILFVDNFFADAMCSLSKVFFDWGILLHMAANPGVLAPTTQTILIPSALAAVPYLIRARQCLVMCNAEASKRWAHFANAIKYSTSIFPLCLSAYSKTQGAEREKELEVYLVILLAINALYALYWDIVMDWGMMQNPTGAAASVCLPSSDGTKTPSCSQSLLRSRLRFGVGMSALIMMADGVLRFSWVLRWYSKSHFPNDDSFILCTQFLEVFRRAIWNLLRVEWENLKQLRPQQRRTSDHGDEEHSSFSNLAPEPMNMHHNEEMASFLHNTPSAVKKRMVSEEEWGADGKLRDD